MHDGSHSAWYKMHWHVRYNNSVRLNKSLTYIAELLNDVVLHRGHCGSLRSMPPPQN